jgi:hypothetical protein
MPHISQPTKASSPLPASSTSWMPARKKAEADEEAVEAGLAVQVVGREADDQPADQRGQRAQRQRQPVEHERESPRPSCPNRTSGRGRDAPARLGSASRRWRAAAAGRRGRPATTGGRSAARRHRPGPAEQHAAAVDERRRAAAGRAPARPSRADGSAAFIATALRARAPAPALRFRRRTSRPSAPPAAARPCPTTAASRGAGNKVQCYAALMGFLRPG